MKSVWLWATGVFIASAFPFEVLAAQYTCQQTTLNNTSVYLCNGTGALSSQETFALSECTPMADDGTYECNKRASSTAPELQTQAYTPPPPASACSCVLHILNQWYCNNAWITSVTNPCAAPAPAPKAACSCTQFGFSGWLCNGQRVSSISNPCLASTSTAASVNSSTTETAVNMISNIGSTSFLGQEEGRNAAVKTSEKGASYLSTIGAIFCAEAANNSESHPENAQLQLDECSNKFHDAREIQAVAGKSGKKLTLTPDSSVMSQEGTKSVLATFEKKFGVSGDDYVKQMLASGGSRETLAALTDGKLPEAHGETGPKGEPLQAKTNTPAPPFPTDLATQKEFPVSTAPSPTALGQSPNPSQPVADSSPIPRELSTADLSDDRQDLRELKSLIKSTLKGRQIASATPPPPGASLFEQVHWRYRQLKLDDR